MRRNERRAKTKRAEHYRQCLPIIANTEKRFFICISLSRRLGSARLGLALGSVRLASSRLITSRLDSFSFVLFRIDLRLVDDSCAMTEIEIEIVGLEMGLGSGLVYVDFIM